MIHGTRIAYLSTIGLFRVTKGQIIGLFGISRDITERKRMEEALRGSEEQFHTLSDFAPIGIFRADREGNNTYVNPRWEEILEMSAADGMGKGWLSAGHQVRPTRDGKAIPPGF